MLWKKHNLIIIIFLLINPVFALQISPGQIEFYGKINENICKEVNLAGNNSILVQDKWAESYSRDLNYYNLKSEVNISYPIKTESGKVQVCISSSKPGIYYGALLFREENSIAGVGTWITTNFTGTESYISKLTGNIISKSYSITPELLLGILTFLLLLVLGLLVIRLRRKK